jgi:Gas vesicle synthesis protein GvpL/GvpF
MSWVLYCVTQPKETVSVAAGVCDAEVQSHEFSGLRAYWSEITKPEACLGEPEFLRKAGLQFQQVLREILAVTTPIPFSFPTLLDGGEAALEQLVTADQDLYRGALERIGDAVQYEITGSWAVDEQADLATPISGREYLKRRQEAAGRIAAIESKLKSVTADSVREWRARQERRTHRWFALVPRTRRERFIALLRGAGPSEGVRLRLSGPWPPREFIKPQSEPRHDETVPT